MESKKNSVLLNSQLQQKIYAPPYHIIKIDAKQTTSRINR